MRLAFLAATMTALGGCMSSPADQLASIQTLPAAHRTTSTLDNTGQVQQQALAAQRDQSDIANQAAEDAQDANILNEQAASTGDLTANDTSNSLVGRKNIAATKNSIYASPDTSTVTDAGNPQNVVAFDGADNAAQPTQTLNAAQSSIFAGQPDQVARDTSVIPLPDARKVSEVQDLALAGMEIPPEIDVAAADPANQALDNATGQQTVELTPKDHSLDPDLNRAIPAYDTALATVVEKPASEPRKRRLTLADFFRKKSTESASFDDTRFGQKKRELNTAAIPNMQTAGLGEETLPGVNAMLPVHNSLSDDEQSEGDDAPAGLMKLASLSGMMRVAPNGLWTQTDKVEVRCLRPQLVGMLKQVENHYGRPVVVTSGFRDIGHNRRVGGVRHSLHTLCAAADIQVEGVSKWQLADYLRSIPGRGGVGTYCHTDSVHIDIGGERDWNWRCRRRSRRG